MEKVIKCKKCDKFFDLKFTEKQWELLQDSRRGLIQDILPDWSADDRELLVSGICGRCYDAIFKENV
jgi:hypothetical protein